MEISEKPVYTEYNPSSILSSILSIFKKKKIDYIKQK